MIDLTDITPLRELVPWRGAQVGDCYIVNLPVGTRFVFHRGDYMLVANYEFQHVKSVNFPKDKLDALMEKHPHRYLHNSFLQKQKHDRNTRQ
jgi:hypothetical protein